MTRTLAALLAAAALLLTAACGDGNLSGDSNPDSQTQTPEPAPS